MIDCAESFNTIKNRSVFINNLISTSYHESGHTIYGLLHFAKIESVRVFLYKKDIVNGITNFDFLTSYNIESLDLLKYVVSSEVCLMYAGLAAERYHFKINSGSDKLHLFLKTGSSYDTSEASRLIRTYNLANPGKPRANLKKKLILNTTQELQTNWDSVSLIAHSLFHKKRLYYSDLKYILTNDKNKKFWRKQFKKIDHIYENCKTLDEKDLRFILL